MKEIIMRQMRASVFDLEEASRRCGLTSKDTENKKGKHDKDKVVVTTTTFEASLPAHVRVVGTLELGIPKQTLQGMVTAYNENKAQQEAIGEFSVNDVSVHGTLNVDFTDNCGTFKYRGP